MRRMQGNKRRLRTFGLALLMVMTLSIALGITAVAGNRMKQEQLESYCRQQEKEMVAAVREFLEEEGYRNSGVMLRRTIFADGSCEYRITIHHGKMDKLDTEQKEALLAKVCDYSFPLENTSFVSEMLDDH